MYKQEEITPYGGDRRKGEQVEEMFDTIAHSYDLLNHSLSLGIDKRWRRTALDRLRPFAPKKILDIATGTGDFAIMAAKRLQPESITGADISEGMMAIGREKVEKEKLANVIHFQREDCTKLSFAENTFDAVTVAYGIRNFEDLDAGLREMLRVLKPGGHLLIIELSTPRKFPMKQLFGIYSRVVMPALGYLISRDRSAYVYLPESMRAFPQGEIMEQILRKNGFSDVSFKRFTGGISTMYIATK